MNNAESSNAMSDYSKCTQMHGRAIMRRVMFNLVGPGGRYTYEMLADLIDVKPRTLKSYALGECLPELPNFLRLCAIGGPDFTTEFLLLIGQVARSSFGMRDTHDA